MQAWSPDGTRQERTGWRDQAISARHRKWGFNCPAVDLDIVLVEYNIGKPTALIEYKHHNMRQSINLSHPTYRAISCLADGYNKGPLPFFVAFYWPEIWAFRIIPVNEISKSHFECVYDRIVCEQEYVSILYWLRGLVLSNFLDVESNLNQSIPEEAAA